MQTNNLVYVLYIYLSTCIIIMKMKDKIVENSDRWCSDICPLEAKHTDTIFNVVWQTTYIHGRSHCII